MNSRVMSFVVLAVLVGFVQAPMNGLGAQKTGGAPSLRAIPGITAVDSFPRGCVDCHRNDPDQGINERISILMAQWTKGVVDSTLLAQARRAAPPGVSLTGEHPLMPAALNSIPDGCLGCHRRDATNAPPFSRLMHLVHLTGGAKNRFLTTFQGECTYCHKMNPQTGAWSIPSGPEG